MMTYKVHTLPISKFDLRKTMLRSSLRDYNDAYILAKGNIS